MICVWVKKHPETQHLRSQKRKFGFFNFAQNDYFELGLEQLCRSSVQLRLLFTLTSALWIRCCASGARCMDFLASGQSLCRSGPVSSFLSQVSAPLPPPTVASGHRTAGRLPAIFFELSYSFRPVGLNNQKSRLRVRLCGGGGGVKTCAHRGFDRSWNLFAKRNSISSSWKSIPVSRRVQPGGRESRKLLSALSGGAGASLCVPHVDSTGIQ